MPESCPASLATGLSTIHPCDRPSKSCPDSHHWRHLVNTAARKLFRSCILRWTATCLLSLQSGFMLEHLGGPMKAKESLGDMVVVHALDPEDGPAIAGIRTS